MTVGSMNRKVNFKQKNGSRVAAEGDGESEDPCERCT